MSQLIRLDLVAGVLHSEDLTKESYMYINLLSNWGNSAWRSLHSFEMSSVV